VRALLSSGDDPASHTTLRKKARPVSDIPAPVLTARQRAKIAKQQKTATPVVGPLDRLIVPKPTALPSTTTSVPVSPVTEFTAPQVIDIESSSLFPNSVNSVLHSTPPYSLNDASSQEQPTEINVLEIRDDTPDRSRAPAAMKVSQPTHQFFQTRRRPKPTIPDESSFTPLPSGRDAASVIDLTDEAEAPMRQRRPDSRGPAAVSWPSYLGDHINVLPRPPNAANSSFPMKARARSPGPDTFENNWLSSMTFDAAGQAQGRPDQMPSPSASISLDLLSHKALATVDAKYLASLGADHELWTTKYRPMGAREVLGNENQAQYMKEWLLALELLLDPPVPAKRSSASEPNSKGSNKGGSAGIKRPRVVRVVEKPVIKKRRKVAHGYDSDWVVSDDDEEELEINSADDDNDEDTFLASLAQVSSRNSSPMKRFSVPPPNPPLSIPQPDSEAPRYNFSARLTNSLLIVGPTGCGKTAAVYACAEELGWGVLEVYPGAGKRAGSQITNLVEGVGKNHTLMAHPGGSSKVKAQPRATPGSVLDKLLSAAQPKLESRGNMIDLDSEDTVSVFSKSSKSEGRSQSKKVNQSIILLEEVDLLFQGESGFWQAVIDVIKESRRPVIMTCNGMI
jgi:hypothetical protein